MPFLLLLALSAGGAGRTPTRCVTGPSASRIRRARRSTAWRRRATSCSSASSRSSPTSSADPEARETSPRVQATGARRDGDRHVHARRPRQRRRVLGRDAAGQRPVRAKRGLLPVPPGEAVETACGEAGDTAAFYCPADDTIYVAQAFAAALGTACWKGSRAPVGPRATSAWPTSSRTVRAQPAGGNRRLLAAEPDRRAVELQADCFAGAWGNSVYRQACSSPATSRRRSTRPGRRRLRRLKRPAPCSRNSAARPGCSGSRAEPGRLRAPPQLDRRPAASSRRRAQLVVALDVARPLVEATSSSASTSTSCSRTSSSSAPHAIARPRWTARRRCPPARRADGDAA